MIFFNEAQYFFPVQTVEISMIHDCILIICKLSCILHTEQNDYVHNNRSSAVEAWPESIRFSHSLNWFDLVHHKFDHRSSLRKLNLILNNKIIYLFGFQHDHDSLYFTYTCNLSCLMNSRHIIHVNKNDTTGYVYIYSAYTLFFLFLPLSAYPKPRTSFLEEREDDEDTIMDHADFNCLNWKEILSLIEKYHKVNSFLVGHDTLIYKNFILPKSLCYCLTRFGIYRTSASGRRGRKATERWKTH